MVSTINVRRVLLIQTVDGVDQLALVATELVKDQTMESVTEMLGFTTLETTQILALTVHLLETANHVSIMKPTACGAVLQTLAKNGAPL